MRHQIGIILAVIMTGVLFFAGGWGYLQLLRLPAPADQLSQLPAGGGSLLSENNVLFALAALAGTGLLAGILIAVPQISPLAAGLPGLLLLGWTGLYLVSVRQGVDLIPLRSDPFGAGFEAMLFNGILGAAGMAMIVPMFVPSRRAEPTTVTASTSPAWTNRRRRRCRSRQRPGRRSSPRSGPPAWLRSRQDHSTTSAPRRPGSLPTDLASPSLIAADSGGHAGGRADSA